MKLIDLFICFAGGNPGHVGRNLLIKANGKIVNLGPKCSVDVFAGVSLILKLFVCKGLLFK